jgi:hypothetical protein
MKATARVLVLLLAIGAALAGAALAGAALAGAALAGAALAGCASGDDGGERFTPGDDDGGDDGGDDDGSGPDAPLVDPFANPYPLDTIALTGTATPGATLSVAGGPQPVDTYVWEDGTFCLLVKLTMVDWQTTENVLFVTVTDDRARTSPTVELHIWTDPSLTPVWRNVAGVGTAMASSTGETCDCAPANATDGDRETMWGNSTSEAEGPGWNITPQWLWVDLGLNHYLRAIQLTWGQYFPEVHAVYVSAEISPTAPDVNLDAWTQVGYNNYSGGDQATYDVSFTLARHVAVTMTEGNHANPDTGANAYLLKELTLNGVPWNEYVPDPSCPTPE